MTPGGEYEFGADENATIGRLAMSARAAGVLDLVVALALIVIGGKLVGESHALALWTIPVITSGVLTGLFGMWKLTAAQLLVRIVTTQGSDIALLLSAFKQLGRVYRTQWIVFLVTLVIAIVAVIIVRFA